MLLATTTCHNCEWSGVDRPACPRCGCLLYGPEPMSDADETLLQTFAAFCFLMIALVALAFVILVWGVK